MRRRLIFVAPAMNLDAQPPKPAQMRPTALGVDSSREAMSDDSEKLDPFHSNTARVDQTFEDIKAEMKRLKLDGGTVRYRNPLDLLEEAYLAIRYPASAQGAASSALLILRGSIDRSIDELARRCPAQKQAQSRR